MPNGAAAVLVRRSQIFNSLDLFLVYPNDGIAILRWEQNQIFILWMGQLFMNQRGYSTVLIGKIAILYQFFMQVSACWKASPSRVNGHGLKGFYIYIPWTCCTSFFLSHLLSVQSTVVKLREWQVCRFSLLPQCINGPFGQLQTPIHC